MFKFSELEKSPANVMNCGIIFNSKATAGPGSRGQVEASAAGATTVTDELATKLSQWLQLEGEGGGEA